jgi:GNAT superfamily N-acetyltransferase
MFNFENVDIRKIVDLSKEELSTLLNESKEEGFRFVETLLEEHINGQNTFNKHGEVLYGVYDSNGLLIAIGGLNKDPYTNNNQIGRIRRFYVQKDYRRKGIGQLLVKQLLSHAKNYYSIVVLNTDTKQADNFYVSLGFIKQAKYPNSTHFLELKKMNF